MRESPGHLSHDTLRVPVRMCRGQMGPEQTLGGSSQSKSNRETLRRSLGSQHFRHPVFHDFDLSRIQAKGLGHSITSSLMRNSFN